MSISRKTLPQKIIVETSDRNFHCIIPLDISEDLVYGVDSEGQDVFLDESEDLINICIKRNGSFSEYEVHGIISSANYDLSVTKFVEDAVFPLSNVERWTTYPSSEKWSVAEHTFEVCIMSYLIAKMHAPADPQRTLEIALFHDLEESKIGDIPRWPKRMTDDFKDSVDKTEEQILDSYCEDLPDVISQDIRTLCKDGDTSEHKVVSCADIIGAISEAIREYRKGNIALSQESDVIRGIEYAYQECSDVPAAFLLLDQIIVGELA